MSRIAVLVWAASAVAPGFAIDIDRNGNAHVTLQDMQNAANAQSRADRAAYDARSRQNSSSGGDRVASESQKWEEYRKNLRQSIYDESAAANDRYDASMRRWAAEAAAKEGARLANIAAAERWRVERIEKFAKEQRRIAAVIMNAEREKVSPTRDEYINADVVAGFAEGLITGTFRDQSLADLQIKLSPEERLAKALKLFGDFNFYAERYGHKENHNLQAGMNPDAFIPDMIGPAALLLGGHGDYVLRNIREKRHLADPDAAFPITAALAAALAMPDSDLNAAQRQQALALLGGMMPGLTLKGDDGVALAAMLVAAAQKNPELAGVKILQDKFIPLVRDSIWAHGFKSTAVPLTHLKPPALPSVKISYWNLASMIVLTRAADQPLPWLVGFRNFRREQKLPPAGASDKAAVQQALQDWFARSSLSPGVQRAIQAECDQTCDASVAALADALRWDGFASHIFSSTVFDLADPTASMKELLDPASVQQVGAASFLAASPARNGLTYQLLLESCQDAPDRVRRAMTALCHLTNIDDALSFPGIPKSRWEALVTLGENYCRTNVSPWAEPEVSARLARLRSERLGDYSGALRWLADPAHQPKAAAGAEPWQAWATLGGRTGLIVAVQRHPEHFKAPALLNQRLSLLAHGDTGMEVRAAVKTLLANCDEVIDPATVLLVADLRGSLLGDWAGLGAWLDDPRRRPKDETDALYPLYLNALLERDMVAGLLTGIPFGPREDAESCEQFKKWLDDVLAATGEKRKKLIDENFPNVIYCPEAASQYPDLRMVGYDIAQGSFASRALLLLSSAEFNPEQKLISGYATIEGDDGKEERIGGYDVEPWLAAVAKLPRTVPPEALLAELSAAVKVRRDYLGKLAEQSRVTPEAPPREPSEAEAQQLREKEDQQTRDDRRTRWVGDGCQDALIRLASRWSPARVSAQATLLAMGDGFLLDDEGTKTANARCIAARVAWEQAKMRGLDDAAAFAAATAALPREEFKTLAALAKIGTRPQPLLLWNDEHFAREAVAAAGR